MMMVFLLADLHRIQSIKVMEASVIILRMVMFPQLGMRRQTRMISASVGERHGCGEKPMVLNE